MKIVVITSQIIKRANLRGLSRRHPGVVHFFRRPGQWAALAVALGLLSSVSGLAGSAKSDDAQKNAPPGARDITLLDQNVYVGSEFTPLLTLDPTDPNYGLKLLGGVVEVYQTIIASDWPKRAEGVALEIAATQPDLVALQEVSLIRIQVPGDAIIGGNTPATEVQMDYLALLLAKLNEHGSHYAAVAMVTNMDMELPMPTAQPGIFADVRLTDHDVILARVDLPPGQLRVGKAQAGNFQTALPLPGLGASIPRGWCAVDVTTRGRTLRFINAHLEENTSPLVQAAQAQELIAGPANARLPLILTGDFNSDANGTDGTTTYGLLTQSFTDVWSVLHPGDPGLTWGHDPLLAGSWDFVWRLDLVLFRGSQFQALEMQTMSPRLQATPPLWPSDHAGIVARLRIK